MVMKYITSIVSHDNQVWIVLKKKKKKKKKKGKGEKIFSLK